MKKVVPILLKDCSLEEFLGEKGWTPADFELHLRRSEALRRFAHQRFAPGLEDRFLASKGSRDTVIYSMLRVKDYGLARELWIRLEEDETTFCRSCTSIWSRSGGRQAGCHWANANWSHSTGAFAGCLAWSKSWRFVFLQLVLGNGRSFFVFESSPARLDAQIREQMLQDSLDKFLTERMTKIFDGQSGSLEPLHYDLDS